MKLRRRLQGRSNSRAESVQRVFENYSGCIALTVALGFHTIATRWTLFSTLDTSLATCYSPSALSDQRFHYPGLLRQPVLVRFRAFWALKVLAESVLVGLRLINFSAVVVLSIISDLITCLCDCRDSSSVGAGPVVAVADAMSSGALNFGAISYLKGSTNRLEFHRSPAFWFYWRLDPGSEYISLYIYCSFVVSCDITAENDIRKI